MKIRILSSDGLNVDKGQCSVRSNALFNKFLSSISNSVINPMDRRQKEISKARSYKLFLILTKNSRIKKEFFVSDRKYNINIFWGFYLNYEELKHIYTDEPKWGGARFYLNYEELKQSHYKYLVQDPKGFYFNF
jgi:hypothetical protein